MPVHDMPAEVPENMANTYARAKSVTVENGEHADVSLLGSVDIARGPIADLAVDGDALVVANFGDNTVAFVDAESLTVRGGVPAGQPFATAAAHDRAFVAVSSAREDAITVLDSRDGSVVAAYPMAGTVSAVAVSPDGRRAFAARSIDEGVDIAVIDVTTGRVVTVLVTDAPDAAVDALRVDSAGRRLFVAISDSVGSRIVVVDVATGRIRRSLEFGAPIRGLELGLDSTAYVLTSDINHRGVLHVIDLFANQVTASVGVGAAPMQLALSADGTRAFVVDYDKVHVVSTEHRAVIGAIDVASRPACLAVSADRLYVADHSGVITSFAVAVSAPVFAPPLLTADAVAEARIRELAAAGA